MKHLFFTLFIFSNYILNSQITVDNEKAHRRYWFYRTRMINDFIKIGKNQGDCIVFPERNDGQENNGQTDFDSKIGPDQIDITNMYMMTLALEYKILSRNSQDVSETVKELFHLMWTINRLDLEAEQFFDPTEPSSDLIQPNGILNGFMLREDMPRDYFDINNKENLKHYNYSLLENDYTSLSDAQKLTYGGFSGVQHTNKLTLDNPFSNHFSPQNQPLNKMSLPQDKYQSMLVAMMFINKYIPAGVTYNGEAFQDGETSLKAEAGRIAKRCYDYCVGPGPNNLWKLRYINSSGQYLGTLTNQDGGDAWVYSWALSREACKANRNFPWNFTSNNISCFGYNDAFAVGVGAGEYTTQCLTPNPCFEDNAVFKAWGQAGSNSNVFPLSPVNALNPIYTYMMANTSLNNIEWADLLRKVLHQDGALLRQMSVYGDPIAVAPCQGPYNYGNCAHGGFEWSSQDRLEHPDARGSLCNGSSQHPLPCVNYIHDYSFRGNYPGVDYMLLHNLYYEYQNQILDGNNGNVTFGNGGFGNGLGNVLGNVISVIYNAGTTVANNVSSALCSIQNFFGGIFQGNSNICDPTVTASGNGYWGSNNVNLSGYAAINYMDNKDENIWPRKLIYNSNNPFYIQGVDMPNQEGKVAVFQNLTSKAHIYATSSPAAPLNVFPSKVTYRAGKEIVFEPGFTIDAGSTFHGYIQRYICNGNSDNMNMRSLKDSLLTATPINLDYESDIINPIPIHYTVSQKSDADLHPVISEEIHSEEIIQNLTSIDEPKSSEFNIIPNPTTGKVQIQTKATAIDEVFSISVFDMKGRLIYLYENVTSLFEINLEGYSKGIYMIQVTSNYGNSMTKKIDVIE